MAVSPRPETISERFIETIRTRLEENKRIRRKLPIIGRVNIDRQLPFLCLYRIPSDRDDSGTRRLLYGEASYIISSGKLPPSRGLRSLAMGIAGTLETCLRNPDHPPIRVMRIFQQGHPAGNMGIFRRLETASADLHRVKGRKP